MLPLTLRISLATLLLCTGCHALLGGDEPKHECTLDEECPDDEFCDLSLEAFRCVFEEAIDGPADSGPDAGLDASPDGALPDAGPDVGPGNPRPFGDMAECFPRDTGQLAAMPNGSAHVPLAFCTPEALAWTGVEDGQVHLWWQTDGEPTRGPRITGPMAETMVDGAVLFVDESAPSPLIKRYVVGAADAKVLNDTGLRQSDPVQARGVAAWVQDTADGNQQIVANTAAGSQDCGRDGWTQWGVAVGPDWLAWFERRVASQRVSLVVTRGHDCIAQRFTLALGGRVRADARVAGGAAELYWIQADGTAQRSVYKINRLRLGDGASPLNGTPTNPVDLAARGHQLVVVGYRAGGHSLQYFDLRPEGVNYSLSAVGNALRPTLSPNYVMWARQIGADPWEIRYARLDP